METDTQQLGLLDDLSPEFRDPKIIPETDQAALTVLSYGCGQDSYSLLLRYIHDRSFKEKYAPLGFVVVMASTGDEHPETMKHLEYTKALCSKHGIEFYHIVPAMGFHSPGWQSLRQFYRSHNTCGSKAFPKTCTDNLKLKPIYSFLEHYLGDKYGVRVGRKQGFFEFARKYGKLRVMLGISKGEEKRIADPEKEIARWKRLTVQSLYPLVDLGDNRQGCQDYIRYCGEIVCPPSNCILCPFMSLQELLWLYRFMPADYHEWVDIERNKLQAFKHLGDRNLGVWGKKSLPEILVKAEERHGHMTGEELDDYKFSHGHCVSTRY